MTLKATIVHQDGRYPFAASAAQEPGDLIVRPDGTLAIFDGFDTCISGERIDPDPLFRSHVVDVVCASAATWAAGATLYWDVSAQQATTTGGANLYLGTSVTAKTSGMTRILINTRPPNDFNAPVALRTRVTTAQVNAGFTLVPAAAGVRYRLIDVALIAIGGNAATATTIDILATQSASSVKLLAAAVAGLTQNTLLRAGATNAAILAAGASFVENDANTAITIGKTGSDLATATNIDVLLQYQRVAA